MQIDDKLKNIFREMFKIDKTQVNSSTSLDNIEEWDSLEHIKLILEVESNYNIKFNLDKIPELTSVGKIQEEINKLKSL